MDRGETERRRDGALADIRELVGGDAATLRAIDASGSLLLIVCVPDKTVRPAIMHIVRRYFADVAIKFEP